MTTLFYNGKVIREGQIRKEDLWVENGKIIPASTHADQKIDLQGRYLAPGYIDLQINGGFGVDFTTNLEEAEKVSKELLKHGVTAYLATLISSPQERYQEQIPYFKPREGGLHGASILGLHLEGPFINPKQNGAHSTSFIRDLPTEGLENFYSSLENVKMVTLAPELPGALDAIKFLRQRGIIVSAGHTDADEQQLEKGIEAGVTCVTHLFNAMTSFHHRRAGVVGATLSHPDLFFSLIADGVHINDVAIQLAWKMNSKGLFLISDAVALWGMKKMMMASQGHVDILADAKKAYVAETGRLAGGLMGLDGNMRHLRLSTGCSLAYAIEAASTKPARILGIEKTHGSLNSGCRADMIVLNEKLKVEATYISGVCVYKDQSSSSSSISSYS
jgi:N-acetylglucosamine-6-phosphate deacetylase